MKIKNIKIWDQEDSLYSRDIVEKAIEEYKEKVSARKSLGFVHFSDADPEIIPLAEVTHLITNISLEENRAYVDIELLNTPKGIVLQEIIDKSNLKCIMWGSAKVNIEGDYIGLDISSINIVI